ncbi:MAG: hypothetical protein MZU91_12445 [Desulfosudis oleivorans]|nr:hypothetical protein [Desulfosudis oleivorans]
MVAVLLFVAVAGSFKDDDGRPDHRLACSATCRCTASGYVASIDNLPLNLNLQPPLVAKVEEALKAEPDDRGLVAAREARRACSATSPRPPASASTASTRSARTPPCRGLRTAHHRRRQGRAAGRARARSLIPDLLARGHEGQGRRHRGAGGHQPRRLGQRQDLHRARRAGTRHRPGRARRLHPHRRRARTAAHGRARGRCEIAIRLKDLGRSSTGRSRRCAGASSSRLLNKEGKPVLELHTWAGLSPFANIASMIDLMTLFIQRHAGGHRAGERDERDADGGVRAHPRDRHAWPPSARRRGASWRCSSARACCWAWSARRPASAISLAAIGAAQRLAAALRLRPPGDRRWQPTLSPRRDRRPSRCWWSAMAVLASLQPAWQRLAHGSRSTRCATSEADKPMTLDETLSRRCCCAAAPLAGLRASTARRCCRRWTATSSPSPTRCTASSSTSSPTARARSSSCTR